MSVAEEQEAMNKRRRVLDLDFDAYLKLKMKLVARIQSVRAGETVDDLDEIEQQLQILNVRTKVNAKVDALRYRQRADEYEEFDSRLNKQLMAMIDEAVQHNKQLRLRIEKTEKLLKSRQEVNEIVSNDIEASKTVNLTRQEIEQIFGPDIDSDEVLKGARVIKEDKNDPSLTTYEFTQKNGSLRRSCSELEREIASKVSECNMLKAETESEVAKWKSLSDKVYDLLSQLQAATQ